jgi:hypothetical protein
MNWINAADRNPDKPGRYYIHQDNGQKGMGNYGNEKWSNNLGHILLNPQVKWLDESEPSPALKEPDPVQEAQADLIWAMIQENQDADNGPFTKEDIEADLYDWFKKLDLVKQSALLAENTRLSMQVEQMREALNIIANDPVKYAKAYEIATKSLNQ